VKQFLKCRVARKFLQRAPILLASSRLQFSAHLWEIHLPIAPRQLFRLFTWARIYLLRKAIVRVAKVFVLWVLAHTVH